MASPFTPRAAYEYLIAQGYPPVQAAALAGNIQQESSANPAAINEGEGAYGLVQWRLDRRQALEDYARAQGKDPSDPYVQLDFIGHEMQGSEARNAGPFMGAQDLAGANAALKKYIRYGDGSEGARLNYAQLVMDGKMGGGVPAAPQGGQPGAPMGLLPETTAPAAPAGQPGGILGGMSQMVGLLGGRQRPQQQEEPFEVVGSPFPQRKKIDPRQLAALFGQRMG